jgi:hypothetical protein
MLCCFSTAYTSPVIAVEKRSILPPRTSTHLLCVPGRQIVPSTAQPRICDSSPRITSGTPAASRHETPGTIQALRFSQLTGLSAEAISWYPAGHGT